MKLKVPFFKQTTPMNCGPVALKMVLAYFGNSFDLRELEEKTGLKDGKAIYTLQIATASALLGHKTDLYSKHILFNEENLKHEFYKNFSEMDLQQSKKWVEDAKAAGVRVKERILSLEELLELVTKDSLLIVLLDWNVVRNQADKGYQGHFVPVVGYDSQNVYVHNHGFNNPQEFMSVPRTVFDKARKASGTDEDIVIVYREKI
jgi:ABC-type bacteriocin/lantibiotic exporter with double-glycine peptidase domain